MAAFTRITVTTGTPVPITATIYGNSIQVAEDVAAAGYPTGDFVIYKANPLGGAPSTQGRQVSAGNSYDFFKGFTVPQPYHPRDVVGYIQTITATTEFIVDESGA